MDKLEEVIKYSKKLKLLIPIAILIIIFLTLTFYLVSSKYTLTESLQKTQNQIILATKLSKLIHETQIERGLSVGFVTNTGRKFHKKLKLQKVLTDKQIEKLKSLINKNRYSQNISKSLGLVLKKLSKLEKTRNLVNSLLISSDDIILSYSKINTILLNIIIDISKESKTSNISQNITAYSNFLFAKEYAGVERAVGTKILSNNNFKQNQINRFNTLIAKQKIFNTLFLKYATKNLQNYYYIHNKDKFVNKIEIMRKIILSADKNKIKRLKVKEWFFFDTQRINRLKVIDDYISEQILLSIKNRLNATKKDLNIIIILNIISIVVFLSMIIIILGLIKNEKKLKKLIDQYVIISSTDLKGIITDVSQAFCTISGYKKEELIGKSHRLIRHPDMPKSAFKDMWATIKKDKTWRGEVKNLKKDGGFYWVEANITPIYSNFRQKIGYSAIRYDITSKKEIEELNHTLEQKIKEAVEETKKKDNQLQQQSRHAQMGEMISMIAHQWRQPLAAISSTSSAINLKAKLNKLDSDTAIELSNKISNYSQHLSQTIDDFREFFKPNKEKVEVNYTQLVKSVLDIIQVSIKNKNIKLKQELNCEDKFFTHPNEIKQVLLNLIKNAEDVLLEKEIKNPCIKIKSFKEKNKLILEVSDNAGGIPKDIIDKIFDPYFSTKTKKDGTGLGLYMSKTIIEEHCGGKLNVKNDDFGAVFTIVLGVDNG